MVSVMTAQALTEIGPKDLEHPVAQSASSVTLFQGTLFLAALYQAPSEGQACGALLKYDAASKTWSSVYALPEMGGQAATSSLGVIGDALYLSLAAGDKFQLLCSHDGATFTPVPLAEDGVFSLNRAVSLSGKIHSLPLLFDEESGEWTELPLIVAAADTAAVWEEVSTAGLGDVQNDSIAQLSAFGDTLYVATANATRGFQVWKADPSTEVPYTWTQVLVNGTFKFTAAETVANFADFKGNLYFTSGIPTVSSTKLQSVEIKQPELIRLYPSGEWDVIMGSPRYSPSGFKIPLSGMGAGFDTPFDTTFLSLVAHGDKLYIAAQNGGEFQLWSSKDAEDWEPAVETEFEGKVMGMQVALSTPFGLVLMPAIEQEEEFNSLELFLCS